jgi:hypothetical protein
VGDRQKRSKAIIAEFIFNYTYILFWANMKSLNFVMMILMLHTVTSATSCSNYYPCITASSLTYCCRSGTCQTTSSSCNSCKTHSDCYTGLTNAYCCVNGACVLSLSSSGCTCSQPADCAITGIVTPYCCTASKVCSYTTANCGSAPPVSCSKNSDCYNPLQAFSCCQSGTCVYSMSTCGSSSYATCSQNSDCTNSAYPGACCSYGACQFLGSLCNSSPTPTPSGGCTSATQCQLLSILSSVYCCKSSTCYYTTSQCGSTPTTCNSDSDCQSIFGGCCYNSACYTSDMCAEISTSTAMKTTGIVVLVIGLVIFVGCGACMAWLIKQLCTFNRPTVNVTSTALPMQSTGNLGQSMNMSNQPFNQDPAAPIPNNLIVTKG